METKKPQRVNMIQSWFKGKTQEKSQGLMRTLSRQNSMVPQVQIKAPENEKAPSLNRSSQVGVKQSQHIQSQRSFKNMMSPPRKINLERPSKSQPLNMTHLQQKQIQAVQDSKDKNSKKPNRFNQIFKKLEVQKGKGGKKEVEKISDSFLSMQQKDSKDMSVELEKLNKGDSLGGNGNKYLDKQSLETTNNKNQSEVMQIDSETTSNYIEKSRSESNNPEKQILGSMNSTDNVGMPKVGSTSAISNSTSAFKSAQSEPKSALSEPKSAVSDQKIAIPQLLLGDTGPTSRGSYQNSGDITGVTSTKDGTSYSQTSSTLTPREKPFPYLKASSRDKRRTTNTKPSGIRGPGDSDSRSDSGKSAKSATQSRYMNYNQNQVKIVPNSTSKVRQSTQSQLDSIANSNRNRAQTTIGNYSSSTDIREGPALTPRDRVSRGQEGRVSNFQELRNPIEKGNLGKRLDIDSNCTSVSNSKGAINLSDGKMERPNKAIGSKIGKPNQISNSLATTTALTDRQAPQSKLSELKINRNVLQNISNQQTNQQSSQKSSQQADLQANTQHIQDNNSVQESQGDSSQHSDHQPFGRYEEMRKIVTSQQIENPDNEISYSPTYSKLENMIIKDSNQGDFSFQEGIDKQGAQKRNFLEAITEDEVDQDMDTTFQQNRQQNYKRQNQQDQVANNNSKLNFDLKGSRLQQHQANKLAQPQVQNQFSPNQQQRIQNCYQDQDEYLDQRKSLQQQRRQQSNQQQLQQPQQQRQRYSQDQSNQNFVQSSSQMGLPIGQQVSDYGRLRNKRYSQGNKLQSKDVQNLNKKFQSLETQLETFNSPHAGPLRKSTLFA